MSESRGVSDVVGFTLVFALILAMVTLVTVVGFGDLSTIRAVEQTDNAQRAFDVVADNIADVVIRGAPSRATEIKLTDATLYAGDPVLINVTASDSSGVVPPLTANATYEVRPIVYEGQRETNIVYSAGAVFRVQREGGIVVRDPPFVLDDDRIHFPMALTQSRGADSIGGSTIRLRAVATQRALDVYETGTPYDTLDINITSPRYELWAEYLRGEPGTTNCNTDATTESVTCDLTAGGAPNRLSIQVVRMTVEFEP